VPEMVSGIAGLPSTKCPSGIEGSKVRCASSALRSDDAFAIAMFYVSGTAVMLCREDPDRTAGSSIYPAVQNEVDPDRETAGAAC
jgi:hypothetical protein